MNYIRYFLYGALAVVCLLLWNTWQAEHQKIVSKDNSVQINSSIKATQKQPDIKTISELARV